MNPPPEPHDFPERPIMLDVFSGRESRRRPMMQRRQLLRFGAVGIVGTSIHYGMLIALVELGHASPVAGTIAGFIVAAFVSYILNGIFTFDSRPSFITGLFKNYIALAIGLAINAGTVAFFTDLSVDYRLAQAIATLIAFIWNYLASRHVVFKK
jgi:putative flippase GtrA